MDFVDKMVHCEFAGCHQADFLPFKCSHCTQKFCLLHKSPIAHSCAVGTQYKDMTSLTCPVCNQSVKFSKAEDPDSVWQRHYQEFCTQAPAAKPKAVLKCKEPSCYTLLGPSNTFNCPKCKENVCLTHRRAEDHSCRFLSAQRTAPGRGSGIGYSGPKNSAAQQTSKQSIPKPAAANDFACPFCGLASFRNASGVEAHINAVHTEPAPPARTRTAPTPAPYYPLSSSSSSSSSGREVCPQCQRAFHSIEALIEHVERDHGNSGQPNGGAAGESNCTLQ